jgi:hypothetical protein
MGSYALPESHKDVSVSATRMPWCAVAVVHAAEKSAPDELADADADADADTGSGAGVGAGARGGGNGNGFSSVGEDAQRTTEQANGIANQAVLTIT